MPECPRRFWSSSSFLGRAVVLTLGFLTFSDLAWARRNGVAATSCTGCHGASATTEIRATSEPATFAPGDDVTFTVTLTRAGSKNGGVYVVEPTVGQLRTLDQELKLVTGGLVHAAPKNANSSGQVSFRFGWRAPSTQGAVRFEIAAVSGDGDGRSSGDAAEESVVSFTYGCAPQTFYADLDRDGHGGRLLGPVVDCAGTPPEGYAEREDDCDDNYEKAHPGAPEICNDRDDDCDGSVDEGAPPVDLWPDDDGDGFYGTPIGAAVVGCLPLAGYAADPGDCAPRDPKRFPGAEEICNLLDDNCDGRVDERLRPQCGVGFCRRESPTCDVEACRAGSPLPEECNSLDDDCNGFVDDGALCAAGAACVDGLCVAQGTGAGGTSASAGAGAASGAAGTTSGGTLSSGGKPGAAGSAAMPGGTGSGGAPNQPDAPPAGRAPTAESGGCHVGAGGGPSSGSAGALVALLGIAARRRRGQRGIVGGIGT